MTIMTTTAMLMMTIMLKVATMVNMMLMGSLPSLDSPAFQIFFYSGAATLMTIMTTTTMMMMMMMTIMTIDDDYHDYDDSSPSLDPFPS